MSVEYNTATVIQTADAAGPSLYPNPVINKLNISFVAGIEKIEIYSLTGVLVKSAGVNIKTIDMSNLAHGCYLVRVVTEQGIFKQTIIKK
jgi:pectate lyase